MSIRSWVQASLLLLSIGLLVGVHAQSSTTGNITGTVRDPQGAAVPKAEVTVTEEKTGASRTVTATEDGFYNATSLPAGSYTISTAPTGFKKTVSTGVELHVNENKTVNLDLQVGAVTETVTVTSESTPVELRSGEVSSLISEKQVTELPLNGRNYAQLALMVPGVSPVTQAGAGARLQLAEPDSMRASICRSTATSQTPICGRSMASTTWTSDRTARCWYSHRLTRSRSFASSVTVLVPSLARRRARWST